MRNVKDSTRVVTLAHHVDHRSKIRLQKMLRSATRHQPSIQVGDSIYFRRDNNRWLGPAKVKRINDNVATVHQHGVEKTTSLNRGLRTQAPDLIENMMEQDLGQCDIESASTQENPVENNAGDYHDTTFFVAS